MTIRAEASSGRSGAMDVLAQEHAEARIAGAGDGFDGAAAGGGGRIEAGRRTVMTLILSLDCTVVTALPA